ncbi:hypothetical protein R1flu_013545 [Riccia fluitans]|uniref:Cytochrome c oxidase assembly factor 3 mitochondrial coiled-coil domain-containing protein n=1 Tax=Riccia fluitans TaxID=41844 RepID=A0ABD1YEP4_9MARC
MAGSGGKLILGMSEVTAKNVLVAGGLSAFVGSVYVYTLRAVGQTDELQAAVETFEREKAIKEQSTSST